MSRLALGTVQFGLAYGIGNQTGQVSRAEANAMLQLARASGIDTLDTAIAYGESEARLGELGAQGFQLVTKLPGVPESCADVSAWVRQQARESLSRLGVSAVYGVLLHRPEQLLGPNGAELYRALQVLKNNGLVKKIGVSIYSPVELCAFPKKYCFDLVQAPFNLVDRRLQSSGWLHRLKDKSVEIHTRSAFLQGLLLMPRSELPTKFSKWQFLWETWYRWLAGHGVSALQASLAVPLSLTEIDRVVIGAENVSQLTQIIDASQCLPDVDLPALHCQDENLINPVNWGKL